MVQMLIAGLLLVTLAVPANAAEKKHAIKNVYLRDGGIIEARSVWRSQGMVHVLVNRDTLVQFYPTEIDIKRTFSLHPSKTSRKSPSAKKGRPAGAIVPETARQTPGKKSGISLPTLPSFPVKRPEKAPSPLNGKEEGAIRKHKKEMTERINE